MHRAELNGHGASAKHERHLHRPDFVVPSSLATSLN